MKPGLLGERETVFDKFHWAQTAANRHGFLMKTVQTLLTLCEWHS